PRLMRALDGVTPMLRAAPEEGGPATMKSMLCSTVIFAASRALTFRWCSPLDASIKPLKRPPSASSASLPSSNAFISRTLLLSVTPASTCTGEVTVALFCGEQIVTEGEAVLRVQEGGAPGLR